MDRVLGISGSGQGPLDFTIIAMVSWLDPPGGSHQHKERRSVLIAGPPKLRWNPADALSESSHSSLIVMVQEAL